MTLTELIGIVADVASALAALYAAILYLLSYCDEKRGKVVDAQTKRAMTAFQHPFLLSVIAIVATLQIGACLVQLFAAWIPQH